MVNIVIMSHYGIIGVIGCHLRYQYNRDIWDIGIIAYMVICTGTRYYLDIADIAYIGILDQQTR